MSGKPGIAASLGATAATPLKDISAELARSLWAYDPLTGVLTWKVRAAQQNHVGDVAGCPDEGGYVWVGFGYRQWAAHRLAWLITFGEWPPELDHRDLDKANNRLANLRVATRLQNVSNVGLRKDNTSGFKGVSYSTSKRKWAAAISHEGNIIRLGHFADKARAAAAYAEAAARLKGQFARLS